VVTSLPPALRAEVRLGPVRLARCWTILAPCVVDSNRMGRREGRGLLAGRVRSRAVAMRTSVEGPPSVVWVGIRPPGVDRLELRTERAVTFDRDTTLDLLELDVCVAVRRVLP
jgi:hypothetical protein